MKLSDIGPITLRGISIAILLFAMLPGMTVAAKLPAWVTSPPVDDADALYGVGEGKDRETAKSAALAAIAGTLVTDVRSSIGVSQTLDNGNLVERVEAQVKTQVRNTELSNYQVVEAVPVSGRWWVLVRLPRTELVNATRKQLDELDQRMANTMARLQTQSIFEQFLNQRPVPMEITEAQATLALLRAASPGFDGNSYAQRYIDYEDRLARIRRELAIRVEGDEIAAIFSRRLVNLLADQGVRVSMGSPVNGASSIQVLGEVEDYDFGSDMESKLTLRLITRDEKGNQLASVQRNKVGGSVTSKESARKQAQNMLVMEAEKRGVFEYLGLTGSGR